MNVVTLMGRLTKDPDLKMTNSGKKYVRFTIAVRRYNDVTDFIPCLAWEKTAELLSNYVTKGQRVLIQGNINAYSYDSNGEKKWITEVVVEKLEFVETSGEAKKSYSNSSNDFSMADDSLDNFDFDNDDNYPF